MNSHADKTHKHKNLSVSAVDSQMHSSGESTIPFVDNRAGAIAQRKIQELAINSPQVKQAAQLQATTENGASQRQPLIQKQENKTGLSDHLKAGIENLSGYSMDDVNVHLNSDKPAQLQAHAYAQGTDIHVAPGQEQHLPHEAWHVVQQKQGRVQPTAQLKEKVAINDDKALEQEADIMGAKALSAPIQAKRSLIENKISNNKIVQGKLYIGDSKEAETKASVDADNLNQSKEIMNGIYTIVESEEAIRLDDWVKTIHYVIEKFNIFNIEKFWNDDLVEREFVTKEHKEAIAKYCKQKNIILSVRDTGKLSLDRIEEGAKPKPHTILEKSIKESSLAKFHPEAAEALRSEEPLEVPPNIGGVSLNDLKGFVGHWSKEGELLGLRVDKRDVRSADAEGSAHEKGIASLQKYLSGKDSESPYIALNAFKDYKEAFKDTWQQFLYTGDYDLHEVYKHNKALMEGSKEKAKTLTGINKQIAADQPKGPLPVREGTIEAHEETAVIGEGKHSRTVPASTLHASEGSDYAMIQHGDQMGYITNQIHEGRLKKETLNDKAQLVGVVASEASGPLAWCVRGNWYVTKNKQEHSELRTGLSLTATSGWQAKAQKSMEDGSSRIMEHKKDSPSKIGKEEEKPWIKNKGRFTPGSEDVLPK